MGNNISNSIETTTTKTAHFKSWKWKRKKKRNTPNHKCEWKPIRPIGHTPAQRAHIHTHTDWRRERERKQKRKQKWKKWDNKWTNGEKLNTSGECERVNMVNVKRCHVESGWMKLKWILVGRSHMGSRALISLFCIDFGSARTHIHIFSLLHSPALSIENIHFKLMQFWWKLK